MYIYNVYIYIYNVYIYIMYIYIYMGMSQSISGLISPNFLCFPTI